MEYQDIFTPGSPPHEMNLLVGRTNEVERLKSYLLSHGIHPLVVGPRGIGKTSLVQHVLDEYELTTQIEANTVSDFDELARSICYDFDVETDISKSTSESTSSAKGSAKAYVLNAELNSSDKFSEETKGLAEKKISPRHFYNLLKDNLEEKIVVSIDELDNVDSEIDIKKKLARFTKSIANKSRIFPHKFIYSGIGKDSHDLLGEHLSGHRSFPVIYLKPLKKENFLDFFSMAERTLGLEIPEPVKIRISMDAGGFPYYVHLIGFHLLDLFHKDQRSKKIVFEHYEKAIERAFEDAFSHYLNRYKFTIYKLKEADLSILGAIINNSRSQYNLNELIANVLSKGSFEKKKVQESIRFLRDNQYLRYRKSDNNISLTEPLMKPFLKDKLNIKKRTILRNQLDKEQLRLDF